MANTLPPLTRWLPAGPPIGCVQIVHGMAEHRERYARFAKQLAAAGYVVWAHDHRGHGTNIEGAKGHFADSDGWRAVIADTATVTHQLAAEHPTLPVFLFGHSMGSFVAQTLMTEQPREYAGVVLAGSNAPDTASHSLAIGIALVERRLRGGRQESRWANGLLLTLYNRQFQPTRTPADWLSRDEHEVDIALADPLGGAWLTTQAWVDFAKGLLALDVPGRFRRMPASLPVLIVGGTRDPVGHNGRGPTRLARTLKRSGAQSVTLLLYPDARHELLNETNRDEITRDILSWLASCTPAR
jgi:alpha-beta hydrolase superfamily lysophospholipase